MRIFSLISAIFFATQVAAAPAVLVKYKENYHGYTLLPRLSEVLVLANEKETYWPTTRLYQTDVQSLHEVELKRKTVLQKLTSVAHFYRSEQKRDAEMATLDFAEEIKGWELAKPMALRADLDYVRAKAAANPKLTEGHYLLVANSRPSTIAVYGLVEQNALALKPLSSVRSYRDKLSRKAGAEQDYFYLVNPVTKTLKVGTALWNLESEFVPPWVAIVVGFNEQHLAKEFQGLNLLITELVAMKVAQ